MENSTTRERSHDLAEILGVKSNKGRSISQAQSTPGGSSIDQQKDIPS